MKQPDPVVGVGDVWAEVIESEPDYVLQSMYQARRLEGIERYGQPLMRNDGRDEWRDYIEELLDAIAYAHRLRLSTDVLRGLLLEAVSASVEAKCAELAP